MKRRQEYWKLWIAHLAEFSRLLKREWDGLLELSAALAPILGATCGVCRKLHRIAMFPVGQHDVCDRLEKLEDPSREARR